MSVRSALPSAFLIDEMSEARARTLALVADLEDGQLDVPHLDVVNPFRWELGHVAYFYDGFILGYLDGLAPGFAGAPAMYDSFIVDHGDRWGLVLPTRDETLAYMGEISERVAARLDGKSPSKKETYCYMLAVLHEDMHGEAFTCMRQALEYPAPSLPTLASMPASAGAYPGDVSIPGGIYPLGADKNNPFVFDNEKWAHPVEVAPFRIAKAPVTNEEFANFVDAGGYRRREFWSHRGWVWRDKAMATRPCYWARTQGGWLRRHFDTYVPLAPHHPVSHVGWYEAEAYCAFAKRRLPTEVEWDVAASGEPDGAKLGPVKRRTPWGDDMPTSEHANLNTQHMGCVDVAAFPFGDSASGCRQMLGNVWEWTASPFYPFPGFVVDLPYREYSAPWFGYRKVLKGGGWATRSRLACNSYRNFFTPDRRDVITGFRTCALS